MNFRKDFESVAKACGVDTLALHPDDMKTEGRYYYKESTEKAHSIAAQLSLKAEARIDELETVLSKLMDKARYTLCSSQFDELDEYLESLLENK